MPPYFGVSSAGAGAANAAAPRNAANIADLISTKLLPAFLLVEPDLRQILVDEVRRADLEPLHIGPVGHDPVPPQHPNHMGLFVEHVFFEPAHQLALLLGIGLVQHLVVKIDLLWVVVISVILAVDRGGQGLLHIEQWIDQAVAGGFENDIELAVAHRLEPWARGYDALLHLQPDLAPLVDQPGRDIFEWLVDIAVEELKGQPLGPSL